MYKRCKHYSETHAWTLNIGNVDFVQRLSNTRDMRYAQDLEDSYTYHRHSLRIACAHQPHATTIFYGLYSVFERFVPDIAMLEASLNRKLSRPTNKIWYFERQKLSRWTHWRSHQCGHQYWYYQTKLVMRPWTQMLVSSKPSVFSDNNRKWSV